MRIVLKAFLIINFFSIVIPLFFLIADFTIEKVKIFINKILDSFLTYKFKLKVNYNQLSSVLLNRIKKNLISNLNFFNRKEYCVKFNCVSNVCFCAYFIAFFLICLVNKIYYIIFMYGALLTSILLLNMLPKVKYYFIPIPKEASMMYNNYKTD